MRHLDRIGILSLALLAGAPAASAAVLNVNTSADNNIRDSVLTLREALLLASGQMTRCLSLAETRAISGVSWLYTPVPGSFPPVECYSVTSDSTQLGLHSFDSLRFTSGVTFIAPGSELPVMDDGDNIEGAVTLSGGSAGAAHGLVLRNMSNLTGGAVRGLTVTGFQRDGIRGEGAGAVVFEGLRLSGNGGTGLRLTTGSTYGSVPVNNRVGTVSRPNFIFSNGQHGISIEGSGSFVSGSGRNTVLNNYVGLSSETSTTDQGNGQRGINITNSPENTVGGGNPGERNVVSGNNNDGITVEGVQSTGNDILHNIIGLDAGMTVRLGNSASGVALLAGAKRNVIATGNVICANNFGVFIADPGTDSNYVLGNFIGTNRSSGLGLGNVSSGVLVGGGAQKNIIGGAPSAVNTNRIVDNLIGIEVHGTGTAYNTLDGNFIGVHDTGAAGPNSQGVLIYGGASNNRLGGAGFENTINFNDSHAVWFDGAGTSGNTVRENYIGTNALLSAGGNKGQGIRFTGGASGNTVARPTLGFNTDDAVYVGYDSVRNDIVVARTWRNSGMLIDLAPNGAGCTDTVSGGNSCVAAPTVVAGSTGSRVRIQATAFGRVDVYVLRKRLVSSGMFVFTTYLPEWVHGFPTSAAESEWVPPSDLCGQTDVVSVAATQTLSSTGTSELSSSVVICPQNQ
jgi:hypothetical protein